MTSEPHSTRKDSERIEPFAVRHIADIEPDSEEHKWLVEDLWLTAGVGIVGGEPKLGKTFLAAEISIAVAMGGTVLGRSAHSSGPVLFYCAEDTLSQLRKRFDGLASVRGTTVRRELPIFLLDAATLRLEREHDVLRLRAAVQRCHPRLLVLDPFVRIARVDENSAAEVSAVLASLRAIQRDFDVAVLLVHHARKSPAAHPNQALRGSSDFAAWSDSNLYLSRRRDLLTLTIEHRRAPAPEPIVCKLREEPQPHFVLVEKPPDQTKTKPRQLDQDILCLLGDRKRPVTTTEIRKSLHRRNADVVDALHDLKARAAVEHTPTGWRLTSST